MEHAPQSSCLRGEGAAVFIPQLHTVWLRAAPDSAGSLVAVRGSGGWRKASGRARQVLQLGAGEVEGYRQGTSSFSWVLGQRLSHALSPRLFLPLIRAWKRGAECPRLRSS